MQHIREEFGRLLRPMLRLASKELTMWMELLPSFGGLSLLLLSSERAFLVSL